MNRYVAKPYRDGKVTRWGVYDRQLGSWPSIRRGYAVPGPFKTEAEAQKVADAMTELGIV